MAKLVRPNIPVWNRVAVAERQCMERHIDISGAPVGPGYFRLGWLLKALFGEEKYFLDHDPALMNRKKTFRLGVHWDYVPRAADPRFLVYRTKLGHHIKTNVRGDGAQFSDWALQKRERRRQRPKRKYNWPKGRKIAQRRKP